MDLDSVGSERLDPGSSADNLPLSQDTAEPLLAEVPDPASLTDMGDKDLRRLLRQLSNEPEPDPMLPRLLEMFRRESRRWR